LVGLALGNDDGDGEGPALGDDDGEDEGRSMSFVSEGVCTQYGIRS